MLDSVDEEDPKTGVGNNSSTAVREGLLTGKAKTQKGCCAIPCSTCVKALAVVMIVGTIVGCTLIIALSKHHGKDHGGGTPHLRS